MLRMLRNPGGAGHAPLTRMLAVVLLVTFFMAVGVPLYPVFGWVLSLL